MTMKDISVESPAAFINRDLSWLEFNHRVLEQGKDESVPLLERLKFLAITASNWDEFFMVRVAALKHQARSAADSKDPSGLTADRQLDEIRRLMRREVADHTAAVRAAFDGLAEHGLNVRDVDSLTAEEHVFLDGYFAGEVLPLLTPLAVDELSPFPTLPESDLHLILALRPVDPVGTERTEDGEARIAVVPIPRSLRRFVNLPHKDVLSFVPVEQVIRTRAGALFPNRAVEAWALFRLTRDADVDVHRDEVGDILSTVEQTVKSRRRRGVVRLEVSANANVRLMDWLEEYCKVTEADVYEIDGLMDATALGELAGLTGSAELKDPDWPPQMPRDLVGVDDIWQTLQERDVLLFHPYESFEPVISLLDEAAADPDVLAIKQTLYRTSNESPVIEALARASENGKQVTVLLEVKARFDEYRNVQSARRLEDAGCHVIYGVAGYKTHSKVLLIVRREPSGIRRYLHMSTGNYNERTARLYSDIGYMTTDRDLASDAAAYFNTLTGYSDDVGWSKLAVAPTGLRSRILELIRREIHTSTSDQPGLIMAKLNSLQHKTICKALYEAGRAGVKIRLNVRGICCLRPGVKGLSENIEVTSIVDRYLEHARVFYFLNGGNEEVYLSSADWMKRNLDNRLEVMFPVAQPNLRDRLKGILHTCFADNVKAWRLRADGSYERVRREGPPVRAQEKLYLEALEAVEAAGAARTRLRPLMNPEEGRRRSV